MNYILPWRYLQIVLIALFLLCFGPELSYATAPKSVELSYDMSTQTLTVTIDHYTAAPNLHHIESVEIKKNGTSLGNNEYKNQPTDSVFTYTYKITAGKRDIIGVTASCNLWGHKTSTLTVP